MRPHGKWLRSEWSAGVAWDGLGFCMGQLCYAFHGNELTI